MGKSSKVSIFVLIDAMGWEFLKDRDFMPGVLEYRQKVPSLLGFSSGVIPSILTGMMPQKHGHWNLFYLNPEKSPFRWTRFFKILPDALINSRYTRKAIHIISKRLSKYGGYFHIYGVPTQMLSYYDICEKNNIYSPGGINGVKSIFDVFVEKGVNYRAFSYHDFTDKEIFKAAATDMEREKRSSYFLYLCELDSMLHEHCDDSAFINKSIDWYEAELQKLYQQAKSQYGEVDLYVFSDHGMTRTEKTYDLMGEIEPLGFKTPRDYLVLYDSTMARFWFFSDKTRQAITAKLKTLNCGQLFSDKQLKELGVLFPDKRFGEAIFLMKGGCLINPSYMGKVPPVGMHGFHPDEPTSDASLLSTKDCGKVKNVAGIFNVMKRGVT